MLLIYTLAPIHTALSREGLVLQSESGCCWELGIWRMHADTETAMSPILQRDKWRLKILALNSVFHPN